MRPQLGTPFKKKICAAPPKRQGSKKRNSTSVIMDLEVQFSCVARPAQNIGKMDKPNGECWWFRPGLSVSDSTARCLECGLTISIKNISNQTGQEMEHGRMALAVEMASGSSRRAL